MCKYPERYDLGTTPRFWQQLTGWKEDERMKGWEDEKLRGWKRTNTGKNLSTDRKGTLRETCPNTELFLFRIFLYSDGIQENTDVNLRIQSKYRKIRTRKSPYLDSTQWKQLLAKTNQRNAANRSIQKSVNITKTSMDFFPS